MCDEKKEGHASDLDDTELALLKAQITQVKGNLHAVQQDWKELQTILPACGNLQEVLSHDDVIVSRSSLEELAVESYQIKTFLPKVLNQNVVRSAVKVIQLKEDLENTNKDRDGLRAEVIHWKTQLDTAIASAQKEKQVQLNLQVDVQELTNQLSQQSEFCSSLGASCCTLLWRVSKQEDSIPNLISGSRSAEFLELISNSVQSYLSAYKDDQWPDQSTDEATFILALCGIITNVAASALGREYLASSSHGRGVIDSFVIFIGDAPVGKSSNMKSLMLMSLFNISINQKGVKYLCSKPGLIPLLCWHLAEEKNEDNRVNTLRLLQSFITDESCIRLLHEVKENLTMSLLQQLTTSSNKDIQDLSLGIVMDIRHLDSEQ